MGNQYHTKSLNTSRVLREIWLAKSISRIEISNRLDLNKSTVTNIVRELLEKNIIKHADEGAPGPKGGRKPVMLSMNRKFGYVLGFEFRPESLTAVAVDLEGEILFCSTEQLHISQENFTEVFFEILDKIKAENSKQALPMLGIGVGTSGIVDPDNNRILSSITLQVEKTFDLEKAIASQLNIPLFIDNDANCCAWGELAFHRNSELNDFIFVLVEFRNGKETGIKRNKFSVGLGLVIDGKVHYGKGSLAGEFRSVMINKELQGQFEVESSDLPDDAIMDNFFKELSENIALLANAFNISNIFLGGDIESYRTRISSVLEQEIKRNWPYVHIDPERRIRFSSLGDKSVAFGAAGMVLNRLLVDFDPEKGGESRFPLIVS